MRIFHTWWTRKEERCVEWKRRWSLSWYWVRRVTKYSQIPCRVAVPNFVTSANSAHFWHGRRWLVCDLISWHVRLPALQIGSLHISHSCRQLRNSRWRTRNIWSLFGTIPIIFQKLSILVSPRNWQGKPWPWDIEYSFGRCKVPSEASCRYQCQPLRCSNSVYGVQNIVRNQTVTLR